MNGDSNLLAAPWAANAYRLYKLGAGGNYSVFPINPFLTSATPYVVQGNFDLVRLRYHIYSH